MFAHATSTGFREALPGVAMKTLVHGAKTLLTEFRLKAGHVLPRHAHPHEQTGYLVSGVLELTIGDRTFTTRAGDSWCIPGGVEHGAVVTEDTVVIEVFSPVREEYLPRES